MSAMAADITLVFKASVKTVKTRNKALGLIDPSTKDDTGGAKRARPRPKDGFGGRAREVVRYITLTYTDRNIRSFNRDFSFLAMYS